MNDWQSYGSNNPPPPPPPMQHGWQQHNYYMSHGGNEKLNVHGPFSSHHSNNSIGQPPLPTSPPPPLPLEPPLHHPPEFNSYPSVAPPPPPQAKTSLFPVHGRVPSSYPPIPHASTGFISEVYFICHVLGLCSCVFIGSLCCLIKKFFLWVL